MTGTRIGQWIGRERSNGKRNFVQCQMMPYLDRLIHRKRAQYGLPQRMRWAGRRRAPCWETPLQGRLKNSRLGVLRAISHSRLTRTIPWARQARSRRLLARLVYPLVLRMGPSRSTAWNQIRGVHLPNLGMRPGIVLV